MHLSFISLSHCIEILYNRYYASNVTEPESDAGMSSHRFTDYDGQSVVFGTIITQFLEVFFLQIWRHFRFWHLFDARKVSRKFGMTHKFLLRFSASRLVWAMSTSRILISVVRFRICCSWLFSSRASASLSRLSSAACSELPRSMTVETTSLTLSTRNM